MVLLRCCVKVTLAARKHQIFAHVKCSEETIGKPQILNLIVLQNISLHDYAKIFPHFHSFKTNTSQNFLDCFFFYIFPILLHIYTLC